MAQINTKRVLLAVMLLVVLVAAFAEAQRYGGYGRGGYGGGYGRGGYGGGRGYYGGGGRGYGRGGYGGGYGRGGYGGGRGYRGGYDSDYNSVYPSYGSSLDGYGSGFGSSYGSSGYGGSGGSGGGGYYDDSLEDDDYSSYGSSSGLEVYATSSSQPSTLASGTGTQPGAATVASASSPNQIAVSRGGSGGRVQPDGGVFGPFERRAQQPMHPWQQVAADNTELRGFFSGPGGGDGAGVFDLITGAGGDQSSPPTSDGDRASERNVLAPSRAGNNSSAAGAAPGAINASSGQLNNRPSVPTSTTTPAPDYVMINLTTS